jgi:hypothetical protein
MAPTQEEADSSNVIGFNRDKDSELAPVESTWEGIDLCAHPANTKKTEQNRMQIVDEE